MNAIFVTIIVTCCLFVQQSAHAESTSIKTALTLRAALDNALKNNQGLAQLRSEAEALAALPSQRGALPDPMLSLNALNLPIDTFDLDQEPMTQMQVSLSQNFPWPGQRRLQNEAASKDALAASNRVNEKRLQIAAKVRGTWWHLAYLDRAIEIVKQNQALMRDFIEIAQTKYKVGKGLQQDVLLAQLELSKLLNRQLPLESMRDAAEADLNALMDRPQGESITIDTDTANLDLSQLPQMGALLEQALANRPVLDMERNRVDAAKLRIDVARKKSYPNITVGAAYGFRDATDPTGRNLPDLVSFRLGFSLPIYSSSKQDKEIEQRSSSFFASKYRYSETLRTVESDVSRYHAQYNASRDQVELYGSAIIPQAQQTVSAMLSGYQVNKVDFLNVINAELALYNAQISYWEALSKAKQSLALLAAAVGLENVYE